MNTQAPATPAPPTFKLVDAGPAFQEISPEEQEIIVNWVDDLLRPEIAALANALGGIASVLRASRNDGVERLVESLADGQIIPLRQKNPKKSRGAKPLSRDDILILIQGLKLAERTQYQQDQVDRFARVCGPEVFKG